MYARIIAADSMGVRSLATFVSLCGYSIGLDLGVAIAPRRYGLPPHPLELERLESSLDSVRKFIRESSIIIITHYHYDHYVSREPELYYDKMLIVKDITRDINFSQKLRGYRFLKKSGLEDKANIVVGDGRTFKINRLIIELSNPVWHGEVNSKVGRVLMVRLVCDNESLVFTSDVQGPADPEALRILKSWSNPRPKLLILGGPPTYFSRSIISSDTINKGLQGVMEVIRSIKPETLVLDHHILRDLNYMVYIEEHQRIARELNIKLVTAAEFEGKPIEQLEARRKDLWNINLETREEIDNE